MIGMPTKSREKTESQSANSFYQTETTTEVMGEKQQMEADLAHLLSQVEGIGEVEVLITTQGSSKSLYGMEDEGLEVTGVLIAATGADNLSVVQNIQEAVQALFQVEAHKIKVMKMK